MTGASSIADGETALVTGAAGWVGAHLVRRLTADGHRVIGLVRPGLDAWRLRGLEPMATLIECDLGDHARVRRLLAELRPELCFHCAWYAVPGVYLRSPENLTSLADSLNLATAARESGCRHFVGVGTCFEYDTSAGTLSETSPTGPRSLYAAAKLALHLVLDQMRDEAMGVTWARLFYLYGPMEDARRLVPSVVRALLAEEPADISPGQQVRDFLHVEDVASALAALGQRHLDGVFNIGSGQPITVAEVATTLGRLCGRESLVRLGARPYAPGDPMYVCADAAKLASSGWRPAYNLETGLADTVRWWRDHLASG
jgi:nucleoside-diphosphate-sugar epimerase